MLYAAPIWASTLEREKNRRIMISAQRATLVRTSTAYSTVSHGALCVLTDSMSIHIKAKLGCEEYSVRRRLEDEGLADRHTWMEEKKKKINVAEDRWRIEWAFHNPSNWIWRLIGDPSREGKGGLTTT